MSRHGSARKQQQQFQKDKVQGFAPKGIHKKIAKLSPSQLRTMFPLYAHLSDVELLKRAEELFRNRGQ